MRINEAYGHEPILPYQSEDCGCSKTGTQCVDISQALTLTPGAAVETAAVTCQGAPSVTCETAADGATCTLVVTQRVCVSVAIRYSVEVTPADPTIACAGGECSCGC